MNGSHAISNLPIKISRVKISAFCKKWKITGIELFGSVLRNDFSTDSDVDILVTFDRDADWGLLDHVDMEEELSSILGRKVDLVSKRAVERSTNWIRRDEILSNAVPFDVER